MGKECSSRFLDNIPVPAFEESRRTCRVSCGKTWIYEGSQIVMTFIECCYNTWFCSKNFIYIDASNHQNNHMKFKCFCYPVLLVKRLGPENSVDLPKETSLAGGQGSIWNQALRHNGQYLGLLYSDASLKNNFLPKSYKESYRLCPWKVTLIDSFASYSSFCWKKNLVWQIILVLFHWPGFSTAHVEKRLVRIKSVFCPNKVKYCCNYRGIMLLLGIISHIYKVKGSAHGDLLRTALVAFMNTSVLIYISHFTKRMEVLSCVIHPHTILEKEDGICLALL